MLLLLLPLPLPLLLLLLLLLRRDGGEHERGCARGDEAFGGGRVAMAATPAGQQTPVLPRRSPSARRLRFPFRALAALFLPAPLRVPRREPPALCDTHSDTRRIVSLVKKIPAPGAAGISVSLAELADAHNVERTIRRSSAATEM